MMTDRERDTVLAALRLWQDGLNSWASDHDGLREIANGNHQRPLTSTEIDALCDRFNTVEEEPPMTQDPKSDDKR
jgi:hypothetical protein